MVDWDFEIDGSIENRGKKKTLEKSEKSPPKIVFIIIFWIVRTGDWPVLSQSFYIKAGHACKKAGQERITT